MLITAGTVALAAAVRLALSPLLGDAAPLLVFVVPVIATSLSAGPRAGVMATLLGAAVGTLLFIVPAGSLAADRTADAARVVVFIAEGFVICWLTSRVESGKRELVHAIARAEKANRAKDEFLAVLSHELRTPLNVILGYARMLSRNPALPSDAARIVGIVERNGVLLTRLVEDLLDLQRIERGQLGIDTQTFDLAPLVHSVTQWLEETAAARRLTMEFRVPSIVMEGDPARLQQVIWNLLSNAVKFTPEEGRVAITVAAGDETVEIQVENSDAPIPPHLLARVFEPFQQVEMTTTRRHSGVGLGLWIAKNLVELHHGTVQVESNEARTVFIVRLPRVQPPVQPVPIVAAEDPRAPLM